MFGDAIDVMLRLLAKLLICHIQPAEMALPEVSGPELNLTLNEMQGLLNLRSIVAGVGAGEIVGPELPGLPRSPGPSPRNLVSGSSR